MINLNAEIRLPVSVERRLAKFAFSSKVRERCWRKLASHQRHRMPIDESLRLFAKQAHSAKSLTEHCYIEIRNRLSSGKSMNEALAGFASPEEILLIYSSQLGGRLPDGLLLAAELLAGKSLALYSTHWPIRSCCWASSSPFSTPLPSSSYRN